MQEFLMKDNEGIFYELKKANMKTAMQEMIQNIIDIESKTYNQEQLYMLTALKVSAIMLLKLEKEQIVDAYDKGYKACDLDEALEINKTMFSGERYHEQTYDQNK
jgi:hypothetical protein